MDEKRARTLCGGGAKGAYEIGAVRALYELGETFDIITGTSIGALTGAMLVQGDAEQLYRLWEGLSIRSVMTEGFAFDGSLETLFRNKGDIVPFLKSYVNKKGADIEPFRKIIRDYGDEHIQTGKLIVYTSADSVFQIAAHEAVVPPEQLYEYCRIARRILRGKHGVGRVIARPFDGEWPYHRTTRRHDFSLEPPAQTLLDAVKTAGKDVIAVGKIHDIFAGEGMTEFTYTTGNTDGLAKTLALAGRDFEGLCFVNLVDFDMLYGHRRNPDGYAAALTEFDRWLPGFLAKLGDDDCVIITADHGCDPGYTKHTDHTREYIPMIALGKKVRPVDLGTRVGFCDIGATVAELLGAQLETPGRSFARELL